MESLSETIWDIVLSGTGLCQSLLALALSRSGKKVLHIDKNDYYGGAEASLSLQEAEAWAQNAGNDGESSPFRNITVRNIEQEGNDGSGGAKSPKLGFSRAYSLSLSPQLIYTRSNLLPALVSSKVYRQLEFLALGSWWLCSNDGKDDAHNEDTGQVGDKPSKCDLRKIPGGREDVFADKSIDRRSMMPLMRFLKLAADPEAHVSILDEWGQKPFSDFLENRFNIPRQLQEPLFALTLSSTPIAEISTDYALPRLHRHLTSIGIFGPGFGSIIPKWGGLAEISQVACRAGAVGGGVYVLKKGFEAEDSRSPQSSGRRGIHWDPDTQLSTLHLEGGDLVKTHWVVGSQWDLPLLIQNRSRDGDLSSCISRSITIVSGLLSELFPAPAEGAPPAAGAIAVFPIRTLHNGVSPIARSDSPPVYMMVHSSDTGECPAGQCVIYGHTVQQTTQEAHRLLRVAVDKLLATVNEDRTPTVLWSMHYDQQYTSPPTTNDWDSNIATYAFENDRVLKLPDMAPGMALEDDVLKHVKAAYERVMGDDATGFMMFEDREGVGDDTVVGDEGEM